MKGVVIKKSVLAMGLVVMAILAGCGDDTAIPNMPQDLTVAAISPSEISLHWEAGGTLIEPHHYKVYRNGEFLVDVFETSHVDTGLAAAEAYCYFVSACNEAGGESPVTRPVCDRTPAFLDTESPTPPPSLRVQERYEGLIVLAWDEATDNVQVTTYNVYRDNVFINRVSALSYIDTDLLPGTRTYNVTAVDKAGNESDFSGTLQVTIP